MYHWSELSKFRTRNGVKNPLTHLYLAYTLAAEENWITGESNGPMCLLCHFSQTFPSLFLSLKEYLEGTYIYF